MRSLWKSLRGQVREARGELWQWSPPRQPPLVMDKTETSGSRLPGVLLARQKTTGAFNDKESALKTLTQDRLQPLLIVLRVFAFVFKISPCLFWIKVKDTVAVQSVDSGDGQQWGGPAWASSSASR